MEKFDKARIATDPDYKRDLRRRCQTDLIFLARDVLGYDKILDEVHRPVVERICVRKNPDLPIEEQVPAGEPRDGLHLDPRGTFKSTLSICDSVQWIICFPNVRICKLTATKPLAKAIANEIRDHFVTDSHSTPTVFQALFPEFCISKRDAKEGEYTAPNRTRHWREETVMAFSIETSISGWHFDVLDPDDVVDTQNSSTPQGIEKVKKNFRVNKKTLMPWGYINFKGTRYSPFDLWGDLIQKATPGKIKMLIRGALTVKSGRRLESGHFPEREEVDLLFPQLLSYDFLKNEFDNDFESFMSQYMNDSQGGKEVTFSPEAMLQAIRPAEEVPISGTINVACRFNYSGKPQMKYAGLAVGLLESGRMWIVDVVRGSFKPSSLAHAVVLLAKKHGTHLVSIEETPGARLLEPAIQNYALATGWPLQITWLPFKDDDGVRDLHMKSLEPLIATGRLLFSNAIKPLKDVYGQFVNYGMMDESEVPGSVALVADKLPASIAVQDLESEQETAWDLAKKRDLYDRTHGLGKYGPVEPVNAEQPYSPPKNDYGLEDVLGGLNG